MLRLTREEYLRDYFDYRPGEHLSLISPTGKGKTHLAYQLLDNAMRQNPNLTVASMMPKSSDDSASQWAKALGLKETADWPPRKRWWEEKPRGHILWPPHDPSVDATTDREQVAEVMRKCLHRQYYAGDSITFADDIHVIAVLMGLNPECEQFWTAGRSSGAGLWSASQKPSGTLGSGSVSSFSYNAPTHLYLGRDTDERNIRRFGEIGGVDGREIEAIVRGLNLYQINGNSVSEYLYIDKRGPFLATIYPW